MTIRKCQNCAYYLTDTDENGNVCKFHHDRKKEDGFCAQRELFYTVKATDKPCEWYYNDREGR